MTTLRRKTTGSFFDSQFPFAIKNNDFKELDDWLSKNNMIIVIKAHHDVAFSDADLIHRSNNIKFIGDDELIENDMFVNHLFNYVNALITDFSSALFDFLYCDKPVGFLQGELKDGNYHNDFLITPNDYVCGKTINNIYQMIQFLDDINHSRDFHKKERQLVFKKFNGKYADCYSREIAYRFIDNKYLK